MNLMQFRCDFNLILFFVHNRKMIKQAPTSAKISTTTQFFKCLSVNRRVDVAVVSIIIDLLRRGRQAKHSLRTKMNSKNSYLAGPGAHVKLAEFQIP